ncbi:MAG: hypothetical protein NC341_13050 [Blautia sp.]|nr:hypothetical protein [Blautia sp.]MCM1201247.1 hypothetical protein [Bacteroides fragilis]
MTKGTSPNGIRRIRSRRNSFQRYLTKHVKKKNRKTSRSAQADIRKMLFRITILSTCGNTAEPVKKAEFRKAAAPVVISRAAAFSAFGPSCR